MTKEEEQAFEQGQRVAWRRVLGQALRELGYSDPDEAKRHAWIAEREDAVAQLRSLCRDFGDNEWDEKLHLGDVIDKHLGNHLHASKGRDR